MLKREERGSVEWGVRGLGGKYGDRWGWMGSFMENGSLNCIM